MIPSRPAPSAGAGCAVSALPALALLLAAGDAGAQAHPPARFTLDVGAVSVSHAAAGAQGSAALTPALHLASPLASLDVGGTWSQLAAGGWSTQGAVSGAVLTPSAFGLLRAEAVGSAAGSAHRDATRTGRLLGGLRLHAMGAAGGAWAGGALGQLWDGAAWRRTRSAEGGLWAAVGGGAVVVTGTPTEVDAGADGTRRYTDFEGGLRWGGPRLKLGATLGARTGRALPALGGSDRARWASASVTAWLTGRLAAVAAGGTYPVDFTQNFPGGRFASLGLRVAVAPRRPAGAIPGAPAVAAAAPARPDAAAPALLVGAGVGRSRTLRVRAPGAARVELTGDPTSWTPVPLRPAGDGWWAVTLPVAPGAWQVTVRVDGGPWRVPAGLPVVRDEFGGEAGLLVVPGAGR
jgi:hypothetical protein